MIPDLFTPSRAEQALRSTRHQVEVVGTLLRMAGTIELGGFRRISDFVSLKAASLTLRDVTLLNRRGMPTADQLDELTLRMSDLTLMGQRYVFLADKSDDELRIPKIQRRITAITPGHVIEGTVSLYPDADLRSFLQASDPPFLPLLDVNMRWLADRRLATTYEFGLLNRTHIVGVTATDEPR
jgi:hypothetical protein